MLGTRTQLSAPPGGTLAIHPLILPRSQSHLSFSLVGSSATIKAAGWCLPAASMIACSAPRRPHFILVTPCPG